MSQLASKCHCSINSVNLRVVSIFSSWLLTKKWKKLDPLWVLVLCKKKCFKVRNPELLFLLHCLCQQRACVTCCYCFLVTKAVNLQPRAWKRVLCHYRKLDLSVITVMTHEAGLYMVNMDACTFLWLKLLIVELWVFARYIFSICVMFSLPLWMASVYCELPLEDLLWDQISLTRWFLLARLLRTFTCSILCSFGLGVFLLGAPTVSAANKDVDWSILNQRCYYQIVKLLLNELSLFRAFYDHLCCNFVVVFKSLATAECSWW